MAKSANQKLKLYYLLQILQEKTDDEHAITMPEMIEELKKYEISAERKSIYSDLRDLETLGFDIIGEKTGASYQYRLASRQFELAELKLLVDLIQSSKFLTVKKSNEMIRKLEKLCSQHDAKKLQREVFVLDRIKTMNESIYYNVDAIQSAMSENKKIRFQYFRWNIKKETELRRDGNFYEASPWVLSFNDENYYLVAFDSTSQQIRHFRVDKMLRIEMLQKEREGKNLLKKQNAATYANKSFGMFGGEEETVKILFPNSLVGVFIDRFGKNIMIVPKGKDCSTVTVSVAVSRQFFGWIFSLGKEVKILSPEYVAQQMKTELKNALDE